MSPGSGSGPRLASCVGCLSWGFGFIKGLCEPCRNFARRWPVGECDTCRRRLPVKKGHCRLCWCQARLERSEAHGGAPATFAPLLPYVRRVRHQQLFLANTPGGRALRERGNSAGHVAHVLRAMGILVRDQPRAFDTWLEGKLDQVAPAVAQQVRRWAQTLHDGGPRLKARSEKTVRLYVAALRPVLLAWSAHHQHLREVSRDEVLTQVAALHGSQRRSTVSALRSLFGWAKANHVIFRDPTARIHPPPTEPPTRQLLTPDQIAPTVQAATAAHTRLAVVLAAVHAARLGDILNMQLTDADIGERRLTIAGRTRPLDDLTRNALNDWLDYRRRRWPNTANPYLFISKETALRLGPVSHHWLTRILRGMPATLERLRIDRHLDEAIVSGADPLHLTEVFGIGQNTALRYAYAARQLLQGSIEEHHIDHCEDPEPR